MEGWIKIHRKILDSPMYKSLNSKQRDVMMQCLLLANHEENEWSWGVQIYKCKPGQFITSLESLKSKCSKDVSVQSIRTSLLILEKWQFLTNTSTKTGRLITICKWDCYQNEKKKTNKDDNKELTNSQQTSNKQLTTNKKIRSKEVLSDSKNESTSLFKTLLSEYNNFCIFVSGAKAFVDGKEGFHLKSIIKKLSIGKNGEEKTDESIVRNFKYILDNYEFWNTFEKNNIKLSGINSNLQNILKSIKQNVR